MDSRNNFERVHIYDTRNRSALVPPSALVRPTVTQNSLPVSAVHFWNDLPTDIKDPAGFSSVTSQASLPCDIDLKEFRSLPMFKIRVKKYLLGKYINV